MGRDPDYLAFVRTMATAAATFGSLGMEQEREAYAAAMAQVPRREMAEVRDLEVPGGDGPIAARLLVPEDAGDTLIVHVHGGGWYLGDLETTDPIARVVAEAAGQPVLAIEHRQAPEHVFPEPLQDVIAALRHAVADPAAFGARAVAALGESSGGNLVAAAARHVDGLAAQILIYPVVDLTRDPERIEDPDGIVMPRALAEIRSRYMAGADPEDPDLSPLYAQDVAGLPPLVMVVAEYDVLRAQGLAYAGRLEEAGVPVRVVAADGLDHAFLGWGAIAERPAAAIAEVGAAIREALA
jgi:acetyl esterase